MSPEEILERANRPETPKFLFGSNELNSWTREHRNPYSGECEKDSGPYVVIHRSLNPAQHPDFRVLSYWHVGCLSPHSWDVPATQDGEVLGKEPDGSLIQWDAAAQAPYSSGESLLDFGEANLTAAEKQRLGLEI